MGWWSRYFFGRLLSRHDAQHKHHVNGPICEEFSVETLLPTTTGNAMPGTEDDAREHLSSATRLGACHSLIADLEQSC